MKRIIFLLALVAMTCLAFQKFESKAIVGEITLTKLWETDTILKTSEAVRYNFEKELIYVSNIGGTPPDRRDGDGYISVLSVDGKVIDKNWVTGIDAPKGQNYYKGKLYVDDIDKVVEIDLETGTIVKKHEIEGAVFLNDLDIDTNGDIYMTDSQDEKIYKLVNGKSSLWLDVKGFYPNGILVEKDRVLILSSSKGELIAIDKTSKEKTVLAAGVRGGDGIVSTDKGYILSAFQGQVFFAEKGKIAVEAIKILDTRENRKNSADISYIPEQDILIVPTFYGNTVAAYKLDYK
ncbi:hypothetical protein KO566_12070 [Flavobacteriaceae bacterium XHP0103]|uniref:hypothetical protein n=1 Tax=Marixanthotalea marina TaxID=2844359 RepID=UPI00298A0173|nr:hypothetical protein [Marixanthotalea marina]MBU3822800.1 hypothetical protein [Marixanthotalea marina]